MYRDEAAARVANRLGTMCRETFEFGDVPRDRDSLCQTRVGPTARESLERTRVSAKCASLSRKEGRSALSPPRIGYMCEDAAVRAKRVYCAKEEEEEASVLLLNANSTASRACPRDTRNETWTFAPRLSLE